MQEYNESAAVPAFDIKTEFLYTDECRDDNFKLMEKIKK